MFSTLFLSLSRNHSSLVSNSLLMSFFSNSYFHFPGIFQCYGTFCYQSVSAARGITRMDCEFFRTERDTVMTSFNLLQFLNKMMEFIMKLSFGVGSNLRRLTCQRWDKSWLNAVTWPSKCMKKSPWQADSRKTSQEIARLLWSQRVHCRLHKSLPFAPIISQMNWILIHNPFGKCV